MNKFPETYILTRLNHEETENLNRLFIGNEIESAIKNFPKTKAQDQMASLVNSTTHLRKN